MISFFEQRLERDFARFQIKIKPRTFIVLMACICIPPPVIILNWLPSLWFLAILCFLSPLSYLALQSFYGLRKEEGITNEVRRWYRRYQFARGSNARPEQAIEMAIWDMQYLKKPFQLILHRWGNGIPMEAAFAETHMDELPMIQTLINMLEVSLTSTDLKVIREQEELLEREMKIQMEDKQKKDQQRLDLIGYTAIITTFALIVLPVIFDSITKMDMIG
ncbi:hypothetical protein [Aneurinibacillus aneurinilyticus]|uniref:hypothetical protein n=1 Tax=Aneurinibacillus aneurinilyticus TaxID=1391 RepID=UPI0035247862